MSSKLDEIRDKKSESYYYGNAAPVNYGGDESNAWEAGASNGYVDGWNDVMNLNLTVKFSEWIREEHIDGKLLIGKHFYYRAENEYSEQDLFDYWLEKIYKP